MTSKYKDNIDDIIDCSIYDICRVNKVQDFIDEGIMKNIGELPVLFFNPNISPHNVITVI